MPDLPPTAVVLLSGGVDSSTCLAWASARGWTVHALTVCYGQRHRSEVQAAAAVAAAVGVAEHRIVTLNLGDIARSALTDAAADLPRDRPMDHIGADGDLPATYVPARNLVLLSLALSYAESIGATRVVLGVNVLDYSGYPDCRPAFVRSFEQTANLATRAGGFRVEAPLLNLSKADIIRMGTSLGLDFGLTVSCYDADAEGRACGHCDSCLLRRKGFYEAGFVDPTRYRSTP